VGRSRNIEMGRQAAAATPCDAGDQSVTQNAFIGWPAPLPRRIWIEPVNP
jgi:hypothetical protein